MKKNEVTDKESLIIKPSNMSKIKTETQLKTGITQTLIEEKGISLSEAVKKVISFNPQSLYYFSSLNSCMRS